MRNPIDDSDISGGYGNFSDARVDRDAASLADPPAPLQIFARLGVLLTVALGFGLAAQLLVRLTPY